MSTFTYIPATLFRANLQNPGFINASLDLHIKGCGGEGISALLVFDEEY